MSGKLRSFIREALSPPSPQYIFKYQTTFTPYEYVADEDELKGGLKKWLNSAFSGRWTPVDLEVKRAGDRYVVTIDGIWDQSHASIVHGGTKIKDPSANIMKNIERDLEGSGFLDDARIVSIQKMGIG